MVLRHAVLPRNLKGALAAPSPRSAKRPQGPALNSALRRAEGLTEVSYSYQSHPSWTAPGRRHRATARYKCKSQAEVCFGYLVDIYCLYFGNHSRDVATAAVALAAELAGASEAARSSTSMGLSVVPAVC